jgi:hypothetical protein
MVCNKNRDYANHLQVDYLLEVFWQLYSQPLHARPHPKGHALVNIRSEMKALSGLDLF